MEYIGYFIIAIVALFVIVRLLAWPLKILIKLVANGVLGAILLLVINIFGQYIGLKIGINIITALIAGVFGIPGVIFLVIFKMVF